MRTNVAQTAQLGDLVAAAFDEAAHYSTDPLEVSRLATRAVIRILRRNIAAARSFAPIKDGGTSLMLTTEALISA